ncbi:MAG: hypothetical protein E6Q97_36280 [Desulfurellales bacterium]|nr:MAG: hypothetical protein E6Q97_36280 [Desulfurellales bacterium]
MDIITYQRYLNAFSMAATGSLYADGELHGENDGTATALGIADGIRFKDGQYAGLPRSKERLLWDIQSMVKGEAPAA